MVVTLDRAAAGPVRLWLTHRSGSAGEKDFVYLKAPVHVPAGATRVEVPIFITDDALDEGDESFGLVLSVDPISAGVICLGDDTSTTVTIEDDDTLEVGIAAGNTASITEGEEATFVLSATNVTGSAFSQTPVKIEITHVDGSTEEKEILVTPNHEIDTTVVRNFSVCVLADRTESRGTLTATVTADGNYTVADGSAASVAVNPTSLPVVSFGEGAPLEVLERDALPSGDVVLYGVSSGDSFGVEVRTETGSAAAGDFSNDPMTATVSGASPRASVALPSIVDDRRVEGDEHFTLRLAIPSAHEGQLVLGSPAARRVTIRDNDMLEISITPNARSFEELAYEPGMTLHAATDNPTGLVMPRTVPYRIRFNDSMSPTLGLTTSSWIPHWSRQPDERGLYTSSFSIEALGYYVPKIGLSTEPMIYSIDVVPNDGYSVAPAPGNSADITITPNPNITKVGIERPVYRVSRGADSFQVAVLLTKRPTERRRIRLRLQARRSGWSRWEPDFDLPSTAFDGFYIASAHVTPESPLRVEMEVRLPFYWETDWDRELSVTLMDDGWAEQPPQYSFSRIIVED